MILRLVLLFFLLVSLQQLGGHAKKRKKPLPEEMVEFHLDEAAQTNAEKFGDGKCTFYCFYIPIKDDGNLIDLRFYGNLSCSHIVYGFAEVNDNDLKFPTSQDVRAHAYFGNFKLITQLYRMKSGPRILLGMRQHEKSRFLLETGGQLARNVSRRMVWYTRRYGFSGLFLKFPSDLLLSPGFVHFVEMLGAELTADEQRSGSRRLSLVLSISSNWARYVWRQMSKLDAYFDAFYFWTDEINSAGEQPKPTLAVPVDPLHASDGVVPRSDAFADNVERLAATGVSRQKIVVGLSAWARSYLLEQEEDGQNGTEGTTADGRQQFPRVASFEWPSEETGRQDGGLTFQELCRIRANKPLDYDNVSETTSFRDQNIWYSHNEPDHISLTNKIEWITNHGFGGVGIHSLLADDPNNTCSRGVLPLHYSVASRFQCRKGSKRGNNANQPGDCTRLCQLDLDQLRNTLDFDQLKPGWCSHLVLGYTAVNPFMSAILSKNLRRGLKMYNEWNRQHKPYLLISFLGSGEQWRLAIVGGARFILIESIRLIVDQHNADGVDINCGNGGPDGNHNIPQFDTFLQDLRHVLGGRKQIILTLDPTSFLDHPNYDFTALGKNVNFMIAVGYRFHRYTNPFTGHHSPMFSNNTLLTQPSMTIQGMMEWIVNKKVPKEKLIVGLSAEAMSMHFAENIRTRDELQTRSHNRIGDSASLIFPSRTRSHAPGAVSQTEVCEIQKRHSTHSRFVNELGVPYLINDDREFIAFDNKRSIQIKTIWISLQNFAGIALHGLEMDNIAGECPQGEPFQLLRTIVRTQVCIRCNPSGTDSEQPKATSDSEIVMTTTHEPETTTLSEMEIQMMERARLFGFFENNKEENLPTTTTKSPNSQLSGSSGPSTSLGHCFRQNPDEFSLFCSIPFLQDGIPSNMKITSLPFDRCDALLLTEELASLHWEGKLVSKFNAVKASALAELVTRAKEANVAVWAQLKCQMDAEHFVELLNGKRDQLTSALSTFVANNNFTGLVMDCDSLMTAALRPHFSQFIGEMHTAFMDNNEKTGSNGCPGKLGLRIELNRTDIGLVYDVEQLNKLVSFVVLPSGTAVSKLKGLLVNPLFAQGIENPTVTNTQNDTLSNWLANNGGDTGEQRHQLNAQLVLLELPTHGIHQTRDSEGILKTIAESVTQNDVCAFIRKPGVQAKTRYDNLAAFWKTNREWLSAENEQTATYKTQFAIQKHLGGMLLTSIERDDPENVCKHEIGFPLLDAVHAARCRLKADVNNGRLRIQRDILDTFTFIRGSR